MKIKNKIIILLFLFLVIGENLLSASFEKPRMAIVISKSSPIKGTAQGWAAVANLSGIPYDCLFLSDMVNDNLIQKKCP